MWPKTDQHLKGIGERLRLAREGVGLSTRAVASLLSQRGVRASHVSIGNYERGLATVPDEILECLATVYKRPIEWLRGAGLVLQGVRYRALKSVSSHDKARFTHEAQVWLEMYLHLESLLGQPLVPRQPRFRIGHTVSGEELAQRIRRRYKFGIYPVPSTIRLLEDFGVHTIQVATSIRIDAFAARFDHSRVVVLNSLLPPDRMRLTALHELGHHLYEDFLTGVPLTGDDIEKRAFEFGSHLLMPESELGEAFRIKSMVRLVEYKERYGISLAAMVYRARKSGLLSQRLYQRLWQEFAKHGFRRAEPGLVPPDRPLRMESLIESAVAKDKTTYADLASHFGTDAEAVKNRVVSAMGGSTGASNSTITPGILNFQAYKQNIGLD